MKRPINLTQEIDRFFRKSSREDLEKIFVKSGAEVLRDDPYQHMRDEQSHPEDDDIGYD